MISDPYRVLGVSRDATKEEIKAAYRKKAKECHPDLHPDDPNATEKMNEINEAYDMLSNPEKYKHREQTQSTYNNTSQQQTYRQSYYGNDSGQGYGGAGDFWGFGFDDFFGFGTGGQSMQKPVHQSGDSEQIRQVVDFINMGRYDYANQILQQVVSIERNARWHYLTALTEQGLGNQIKALEEIKKAMQIEPDNPVYTQTYNSMNRTSSQYQDVGREYQDAAQRMQQYCLGFCLLNFFCTFCRCC
ncbi:MAG: DnaJ domain-containing protein [Bariatricus sp.]